MEEDRGADGHHQALLPFSSYRRESTADGPIWGEALDRLEQSFLQSCKR